MNSDKNKSTDPRAMLAAASSGAMQQRRSLKVSSPPPMVRRTPHQHQVSEIFSSSDSKSFIGRPSSPVVPNRPASSTVSGTPPPSQGPTRITVNVPSSPSVPQRMPRRSPIKTTDSPIQSPSQPVPGIPPTQRRSQIIPTTSNSSVGEICDRCENVSAAVKCIDCGKPYCSECNAFVHMKGRWAQHSTVPVGGFSIPRPSQTPSTPSPVVSPTVSSVPAPAVPSGPPSIPPRRSAQFSSPSETYGSFTPVTLSSPAPERFSNSPGRSPPLSQSPTSPPVKRTSYGKISAVPSTSPAMSSSPQGPMSQYGEISIPQGTAPSAAPSNYGKIPATSAPIPVASAPTTSSTYGKIPGIPTSSPRVSGTPMSHSPSYSPSGYSSGYSPGQSPSYSSGYSGQSPSSVSASPSNPSMYGKIPSFSPSPSSSPNYGKIPIPVPASRTSHFARSSTPSSTPPSNSSRSPASSSPSPSTYGTIPAPSSSIPVPAATSSTSHSPSTYGKIPTLPNSRPVENVTIPNPHATIPNPHATIPNPHATSSGAYGKIPTFPQRPGGPPTTSSGISIPASGPREPLNKNPVINFSEESSKLLPLKEQRMDDVIDLLVGSCLCILFDGVILQDVQTQRSLSFRLSEEQTHLEFFPVDGNNEGAQRNIVDLSEKSATTMTIHLKSSSMTLSTENRNDFVHTFDGLRCIIGLEMRTREMQVSLAALTEALALPQFYKAPQVPERPSNYVFTYPIET